MFVRSLYNGRHVIECNDLLFSSYVQHTRIAFTKTGLKFVTVKDNHRGPSLLSNQIIVLKFVSSLCYGRHVIKCLAVINLFYLSSTFIFHNIHVLRPYLSGWHTSVVML